MSLGIMRFFIIIILGWVLTFQSCKEASHVSPLKGIVGDLSPELREILEDPKHEVQLIYTKIIRNKDGTPSFQIYNYNVDPKKYFYPASTVKMPVAFLALQRINELRREDPSIDMRTAMIHEAGTPPQQAAETDSSSTTGYPNVAHYVEQIFSVSDNDAYNRLYEFLGQDYINEELRKKGVFQKSRIRTRVGITGFDTESNKYTNPIKLIGEDGDVSYEQDEYYALYQDFEDLDGTSKGVGYYSDDLDSVIMKPFDMGEKNFITIEDLEASLKRVIFPEAFPELQRFDLSKEQYEFLYDIMPKSPLDFSFHKDHYDEYTDNYVKFFWHQAEDGSIPDHIEIYNKVGWAYGTLTDCSYIKDTKNNIDFFLTATILVNDNGIFNDGKYEYEEVGLPFLAGLGKAVYEYELGEKK